MSDAERNPVWVNCGKCGHDWVAAYVPMEISKMAKLIGRLRCPVCVAPASEIFMGRNPKRKLEVVKL